MKKFMVLITMLSVVSAGVAAVPSYTLFSDNFNRADNHDIDAEATGMGGLLAPLTLVEMGDDVVFPIQSGTGLPNTGLTRIQANQLYQAAGPNASTLYVDHNFVDSQITAADGMRIGLTITANLGNGTTGDFFCGFGVGNTLTECQTTWLDHNGTGFRGQNVGATQAGTSDLWVGWSPANGGTIQVFKNGPTAAGGYNYALVKNLGLTAGDRLELELYFDDFADNSPVTAYILWNGKIIGTEHFNWDADGVLENYIGINARQGNGFVVDDLAVEAIYNDRAADPVPADQSIDVPTGTVTLQWTPGKDALGNLNANIGAYYVYVADNLAGTEPNFIAYEEIPAGTTAYDIAVDFDQTIYWRVDQGLLENGTVTGPAEPNTIVGLAWSFETLKSVPVIVTPPSSLLVEAGQPAQFSVSATSLTPVQYAWFKTADGVIDTPDDDVLMGTAADLMWTSVSASDEGYYFCRLINDSGEASAVYTPVVMLGVVRQVAHWTFDSADFVDGLYQDISGSGHHAEPNVVPGAFVDGVSADKTGQAVDWAAQPLAVADAGDWAPSAYTGQFTFSGWLKWAGPNASWQGVLANRINPTTANFYVEIRKDNGNIQIGSPHFGSGDLIGTNLPVGQWVHFAISAAPGGITLYMDGMPVASRIPARDIPFAVLPVYVGALGRTEAGVLSNPFNGVFDDVRVYNRAFDQYEIADLYYSVQEKPLCLNPENVDLQFDVAGGGIDGDQPDCRVDLADMAALSASWLNCGLYPQEDC